MYRKGEGQRRKRIMGPNAHQNAAFDGIVKAYYTKILKFCAYRLGGNLSAAEDCVQDIFLILYENMGKLRDYDKIGGWLYKTAGNLSRRYAAALQKECAKRAVAVGTPEEGDMLAPVDRIAAKTIKTEEERVAEESVIENAAREIGRRLKPNDGRVLELIREKRSLKEIASRLDISLSAAKSRVSRLRQKISTLVHELLTD
jgi:RNA polymerase sigma factor (sigma-70 family)